VLLLLLFATSQRCEGSRLQEAGEDGGGVAGGGTDTRTSLSSGVVFGLKEDTGLTTQEFANLTSFF
jgi:hypothetical protein